MKRLLLLALAASLAAAPRSGAAQTTPKPTAATSQYVMQGGEVRLRQGSQTTPLSQNVVLANGTKVNYKSGIVEFTTGKKTTLREGDYVTPTGDVVFATPGSAAGARGADPATAPGQFDRYVERGQAPSVASLESRLAAADGKLMLLARKIQLLNDKISLMTPNAANQATLDQLNQQLKALDEQLAQAK